LNIHALEKARKLKMLKKSLKTEAARAVARRSLAMLVSLLAVSAAYVSPFSVRVTAWQSAPQAGNARTISASASVNIAASPATPKVGEAAPEFRLPYATKEKIFFRPDERLTLSSLKGKNVVLAFYPADWSGGCTTEVCTFRDTFIELGKLNAIVLGVSGDYVFSHHEWAKHHNLPFPLLSDHDHSVAKAYGSYNEQYGLNNRTIFLIDKEGIVRYVNLAFKASDKKDYDALRAELEKLK
jgi:peroxiredoxin